MMDSHNLQLKNFCRICGSGERTIDYFPERKADTNFISSCVNFLNIDHNFENEDPNVYPQYICYICYRKLNYFKSCENGGKEPGKIDVASFESHSDHCAICQSKCVNGKSEVSESEPPLCDSTNDNCRKKDYIDESSKNNLEENRHKLKDCEEMIIDKIDSDTDQLPNHDKNANRKLRILGTTEINAQINSVPLKNVTQDGTGEPVEAVNIIENPKLFYVHRERLKYICRLCGKMKIGFSKSNCGLSKLSKDIKKYFNVILNINVSDESQFAYPPRICFDCSRILVTKYKQINKEGQSDTLDIISFKFDPHQNSSCVICSINLEAWINSDSFVDSIPKSSNGATITKYADHKYVSNREGHAFISNYGEKEHGVNELSSRAVGKIKVQTLINKLMKKAISQAVEQFDTATINNIINMELFKCDKGDVKKIMYILSLVMSVVNKAFATICTLENSHPNETLVKQLKEMALEILVNMEQIENSSKLNNLPFLGNKNDVFSNASLKRSREESMSDASHLRVPNEAQSGLSNGISDEEFIHSAKKVKMDTSTEIEGPSGSENDSGIMEVNVHTGLPSRLSSLEADVVSYLASNKFQENVNQLSISFPATHHNGTDYASKAMALPLTSKAADADTSSSDDEDILCPRVVERLKGKSVLQPGSPLGISDLLKAANSIDSLASDDMQNRNEILGIADDMKKKTEILGIAPIVCDQLYSLSIPDQKSEFAMHQIPPNIDYPPDSLPLILESSSVMSISQEDFTKMDEAASDVVLSVESKASDGNVASIDVSDKKERQKKHECTLCGKMFRKPSELIRHTRTHTGEKPYGCDLCTRKFAIKTSLWKHYEIHQKKSCEVCLAKYETVEDLKAHMKVHDANVSFQCLYCPRMFRLTGHRKLHMLSIHSSKIEEFSKIPEIWQLQNYKFKGLSENLTIEDNTTTNSSVKDDPTTLSNESCPTTSSTEGGDPTSLSTEGGCPTTSSTEDDPTTLSNEGGDPTTIATEGGPTSLSAEDDPTTISTEGEPTTLSTESGPTTLSTESGPTTTISSTDLDTHEGLVPKVEVEEVSSDKNLTILLPDAKVENSNCGNAEERPNPRHTNDSNKSLYAEHVPGVTINVEVSKKLNDHNYSDIRYFDAEDSNSSSSSNSSSVDKVENKMVVKVGVHNVQPLAIIPDKVDTKLAVDSSNELETDVSRNVTEKVISKASRSKKSKIETKSGGSQQIHSDYNILIKDEDPKDGNLLAAEKNCVDLPLKTISCESSSVSCKDNLESTHRKKIKTSRGHFIATKNKQNSKSDFSVLSSQKSCSTSAIPSRMKTPERGSSSNLVKGSEATEKNGIPCSSNGGFSFNNVKLQKNSGSRDGHAIVERVLDFCAKDPHSHRTSSSTLGKNYDRVSKTVSRHVPKSIRCRPKATTTKSIKDNLKVELIRIPRWLESKVRDGCKLVVENGISTKVDSCKIKYQRNLSVKLCEPENHLEENELAEHCEDHEQFGHHEPDECHEKAECIGKHEELEKEFGYSPDMLYMIDGNPTELCEMRGDGLNEVVTLISEENGEAQTITVDESAEANVDTSIFVPEVELTVPLVQDDDDAFLISWTE